MLGSRAKPARALPRHPLAVARQPEPLGRGGRGEVKSGRRAAPSVGWRVGRLCARSGRLSPPSRSEGARGEAAGVEGDAHRLQELAKGGRYVRVEDGEKTGWPLTGVGGAKRGFMSLAVDGSSPVSGLRAWEVLSPAGWEGVI